ncbi:HNH endonuclease [Yeosuana sp.]|uniref:HNH endonuclease n=1 Tax=Yeosuana sp. TaxID=2529388 RepID=UPI004054EF1D
MPRLKFEWCCNKTETFSQWEIPCEGCDRSCENLTKVSPYRGILGKDRNRLLERDKVCLKCGSDNKLTIDHIVPISKGGSNDFSNLQILCEKCNSLKGSKVADYR